MFRPVLLLPLLASLGLSAQGRLRGERPFPPRREMRRDMVMTRLHQMRMARLQNTLGVPEDKARAIADRWGRFDEESVERRQDMRRLREQVNGILMGPGAEEDKNARLRPLIDRLAAHQKAQQEARQVFETEIRQNLTPAQQARFLMLVEEFQQSLKDALAEQRRDR